MAALEQALASEQDELSSADALAETADFSAKFPSMTEAEMIKASLESLTEYQRTGEGFTQQEMDDWAVTLAHRNDKQSQ